MSFTHLAFDIDGTLISSEYANMKALQDTLIKFHGSSPSLEELSPVFGIPGMDALARLGVTDTDVIYPYWAEHVHDYDDTIAPYDGVLELLEALQAKGYPMAVVSSKRRREYDRGFVPMGLSTFFDIQVLEEDTQKHKPDPEPLLKYLELAGVGAERVLYIGDRLGDWKCAHAAGVPFAFARWGAPFESIPEADYVLETPADLLNIV